MCGICGIFDYQGERRPSTELIQEMCRRMVHRGPDDQGEYVAGRIALGMRRLSIIDLAGGHQPLPNEDQSVWVVFNGEIYNYRELRVELQARGHVFRTESDTEVIVHGYEEWGDDCVLRFNGIFGLAVWDQRRHRLLLARDHFGVKPVYYCDDGRRLIWGSEIKAILAVPGVGREVDLEALDSYLVFRTVPSPATMFKGISKLRPGHRLLGGSSGTRVERYWEPEATQVSPRTEEECVVELQDRFETAVRRQMVGDVPVGALLSGGIDSAMVVAVMSRVATRPVLTFTVGFKGGGKICELAEARQTAKLFGTDHHEIVLSHSDYRELLGRMIWHLDEPIATTSAVAMQSVCQLAHPFVKVVLTGQGADEPMAGYVRYYGERYGHWFRCLPRALRESLLRPMVEALPRCERAKRAVRSLGLSDVAERFAASYEVFPAALRARLWRLEFGPRGEGGRSLETVRYWLKGVEARDSLGQMCYVDARLALADDLLLYGDKMSMASSVEARVPFLDFDFMALAEQLPAKLRIQGLTRKYIQKRVAAKWLPASIIHRRKRAFETPMDHWLQSEMSGYVEGMLVGKGSACTRYFQAGVLEELLRDHVQGRQDYRRQLFALLVFELWHRMFIDQSMPLEVPGAQGSSLAFTV